jgi:hypothetical protein
MMARVYINSYSWVGAVMLYVDDQYELKDKSNAELDEWITMIISIMTIAIFIMAILVLSE